MPERRSGGAKGGLFIVEKQDKAIKRFTHTVTPGHENTRHHVVETQAHV
jgi:hypothetical protein